MGNRKIIFTPENYYHIYNRGNSKQVIFLEKSDYDHFMKLLFICNSSKSFKFRDDVIQEEIDAYDFERGVTLVNICSWVLMPNHFHLLVHFPQVTPVEET